MRFFAGVLPDLRLLCLTGCGLFPILFILSGMLTRFLREKNQYFARSGNNGQGKPEGGTFPRCALHPNFSLMLSNEGLTDV